MNMNIWVGTSGFAVPRNIKSAVIGFRVDNSWITANGISGGGVKLFKWDGAKWNELETRLLSKDGSATNYEAKTEGFSHFAISGIKTSITGTTPWAASPPEVTIRKK